ncbi:MAG: hypothetical protein R3C32_07825 [Chloroflexota bacterium]
MFLDPRSRTFYADWDRAANDMAALLRSEVARSRDDAALAALIDELMSGSADFRRRWAAHDVLFHRHGTASFRHPVVGLLVLSYEDLDLPTDRDQMISGVHGRTGVGIRRGIVKGSLRPRRSPATRTGRRIAGVDRARRVGRGVAGRPGRQLTRHDAVPYGQVPALTALDRSRPLMTPHDPLWTSPSPRTTLVAGTRTGPV